MIYFIYFISAYGIFEIVSNTFHLSKGSIGAIGQSAKKQHRELPLNISDMHFFVKAIIMLIFGLMFSAAALMYFLHTDAYCIFAMLTFSLHGAYGLVQAVLYRKFLNVWPAAVVYNIPLIVFLLLYN
ncbi:MAG: hypothetical protein PHN88_15300 [Ignavibacteria bacterium]|nr:hypothetical protein [Ignavibacteria bacterium]